MYESLLADTCSPLRNLGPETRENLDHPPYSMRASRLQVFLTVAGDERGDDPLLAALDNMSATVY